MEHYDETPGDLGLLIQRLAEHTGLPRDAAHGPPDADALGKAALAFATAAREVFRFELDLERNDAAQLDRLANAHLIDPRVRDLFDGAEMRYDAPKDRRAAYDALKGRLRLPPDPLFLYGMGAWWGEWLARHAAARWFLDGPVDPCAERPDFAQEGTVLLAFPFAHAAKKLSNPEGDSLAYKAEALVARLLFPPLALAAAPDAAEAIRAGLLPEALDRARNLLSVEQPEKAFEMLAAAVTADPRNGHLLHEVERLGWEHDQFALVHHCCRLQVELAPGNPRILYNYAVIESMREGGVENAVEALLKALEIDPAYDRARLTLADCLREAGRVDEAREHAKHRAGGGGDLATAAAELLDRLGE